MCHSRAKRQSRLTKSETSIGAPIHQIGSIDLSLRVRPTHYQTLAAVKQEKKRWAESAVAPHYYKTGLLTHPIAHGYG